jgi:hypothetical protein
MGRAGIEPATLGLKVGCQALVVAWARWPKPAVEPNQLACSRVLWRSLVDLLLTHLVSCIDNERDEIRGEVDQVAHNIRRWRGHGATVLLVQP